LREEVAEAMDGFEHRGGAGVGVNGAVYPGVAVVAGDDPIVFLGGTGAGDSADDVPYGAEGDVLLEVHVDGDAGGIFALCAGAEVVSEGKRALPFAGRLVAAEGF